MTRKRNNKLLLATLAAGAYAYFSKKENRDKAQISFNNMKTKVESFIFSLSGMLSSKAVISGRSWIDFLIPQEFKRTKRRRHSQNPIFFFIL